MSNSPLKAMTGRQIKARRLPHSITGRMALMELTNAGMIEWRRARTRLAARMALMLVAALACAGLL